MQSPLAPSKELCMVCPQPTQGAPQNPCPAAEWVPSLEGHSGGTRGWVKALTWVSCSFPPPAPGWVLESFTAALLFGMAIETPRSQQETDLAVYHRAAQPRGHGGMSPPRTQGLKPKDPVGHPLHGLEAPKTLWPISFMDQGS